MFKQAAMLFMQQEGIELLIDMARKRDGFALKLLAEYAYGKPQQHVDISGLDSSKVVFQIVYSDISVEQSAQAALPDGDAEA